MSKLAKVASAAATKVYYPPFIDMIIPAGGATTGPPLGPTLGQRGVAIAKFVKDFNTLTKDFRPGTPIPTLIHLEGKKYSIELREPDSGFLLCQAAGIKEGSKSPEEIVGKLTYKHIYEIAKVKVEQENYKIRSTTMQEMCETLAKQCWELGIQVVRHLDATEYRHFLEDLERQRKEEQERREAEMVAKGKK